MTGAHASERLIARYAQGETGLPGDQLWALEAHLEQCSGCRARLATVAGEQAPAVAALLDDVWSGLAPRLEETRPTAHRRRWAGRLRTWLTPVMVPWLVMTVAVVLLAAVLDGLSRRLDGDLSLVLLVAPVLPVLGVATAWTRGLDPAYELTAATPRAGLHLVLRRTTSVLVVVIPVLLAAGWVTGVALAQWLLPCLAFTTTALALGGLIGVTRAALALVSVWIAVIVAPTLTLSHTSFALQPGVLPAWAALGVLGAAVVAVRRSAYTHLSA